MHYESAYTYKAMFALEMECDKKGIALDAHELAIYQEYFSNVTFREYGETMNPLRLSHARQLSKVMLNMEADRLVRNAARMPELIKNKLDPLDHVHTAAKYLFAIAMARGQGNDMPYLFGEEFQKAMKDCAYKIYQAYIPKVDGKEIYDKQRGKNADVMRKENVDALMAKVKSGDASIKELKSFVAEYQALVKRQADHNGVWRLFHRSENAARETLKQDMKEAIAAHFGENFDAAKADINEIAFSREEYDAKMDKLIEEDLTNIPKAYGFEMVEGDVDLFSKPRTSEKNRYELNSSEKDQLHQDTSAQKNQDVKEKEIESNVLTTKKDKLP
jgi:hypothetical protein